MHRWDRTSGNLCCLPMAVAVVIAGCSTSTPRPASNPNPTPVAAVPLRQAGPVPVALTRDQRIGVALGALNDGEAGTARVGLVEMLAETPGDPVATDLLRQIDTDPKELLGDRSFLYTIRSRETLATIAQRFLGNANRFWALARYNNIAVPAKAGVGRVIRVPGEAPTPRQVRAPRPAAAAGPAPAVVERVLPPPPPAPTPAQIASANELRAAGLNALVGGSIDRAVGLLSRAASLNPRDTTIQSDLARALKVQERLRRH